MKVLYVIPSVSPLRGGSSVAVRTMARGLSEQGVTVHVATTDDNGRGRLTVPYGRPVVEDGFTCWYFRRQTRFYTVSWPLCHWLARHAVDYDLIHIHALFTFATTVAAFWGARRGVPYVVEPHGMLNTWGIENRRPLLKQFSLSMIERHVLSNAAATHYTSEQEKHEAERSVRGTREIVIPNPVGAGGAAPESTADCFLARFPKLSGRQIVLFLSRLDPKKGLDLLLTAFAMVRAEHSNVTLVVAGNGDRSFIAGLQGQARDLGVAEDIVWAGFLEGHEKYAAFNASEVFVLPSYSENFGIAVVEAMGCGLPVIVSNQVGIHHEVADARAGLAVRCDPTELKHAILSVLENPDERARMASNASQLAKQFSPAVVSRRLVEVYRGLCVREPDLPSALHARFGSD